MKEWKKDKVTEMATSRIIGYSGKTLCENYRGALERCETAAQAIRLYKSCISWALQEQYPTKDDLLTFADKETLAANGVYVDMAFSGERIDGHICCVFLNCRGWIRTGLNTERGIIPMLYLSEGSDLKVQVEDGLRYPIPVELYYGSKVGGRRKRLTVKNCNGQTRRNNKGFTAEELRTEPDIDNSDL